MKSIPPARRTNRPQTKQTDIAALRVQVSALHDQFTDLKHSSYRWVEVLKWGMGMLIVLVIVFAGSNWWIGKTNYDKDKEFRKQQTEIIQQKLAMYQTDLASLNEKQLAEIRSRGETNYTGLCAVMDKRIMDAFMVFSNSIAAKTESVANEMNDLFEGLSLTNRMAILNLQESNVLAIANVQASVRMLLSKAEGITLFVQGSQLCRDNKGDTLKSACLLAGGVRSCAEAATDLVECNDEVNAQNCLRRLTDTLPVLITNAPSGTLDAIERTGELRKSIALLVSTLEQPKNKSRYSSELMSIKAYGRLIEQQMKEEAEAGIAPYREDANANIP